MAVSEEQLAGVLDCLRASYAVRVLSAQCLMLWPSSALRTRRLAMRVWTASFSSKAMRMTSWQGPLAGLSKARTAAISNPAPAHSDNANRRRRGRRTAVCALDPIAATGRNLPSDCRDIKGQRMNASAIALFGIGRVSYFMGGAKGQAVVLSRSVSSVLSTLAGLLLVVGLAIAHVTELSRQW